MDEEAPPKLSWDYQTFLIDGAPFYPTPDNTLIVELPCQPHADLSWTVPSTTKKILWRFVFDLEAPFFPLTDEQRFQALALACKHFSQTIWPLYKEQSLGGILFQGSADFHSHFLWNDLQKTNYETWTEQNKNAHPQFFCADALSSYCQLLAHHLPDELPLVLCFDASPLPSLTRALNLLSRERFEHFLIAIQAPRWPMPSLRYNQDGLSFLPLSALTGLCFPKNECMTEETFFEIDKIIDALYESNHPFRVVFEEFLAEQWDGLDEIQVLPHSLSAQGRRKLLGFEAAGGTVREL
ncbi:MAG TPA: hypothetical protein DCE71_02660 [Parachlamydiales bacterium]|nr:hypothetical protein [Parachlamydiales bacterium]